MEEEPMGRMPRRSRHAASGLRSTVGGPLAVRLFRLTSLRPATARALAGAVFSPASRTCVRKTVTFAVRDARR